MDYKQVNEQLKMTKEQEQESKEFCSRLEYGMDVKKLYHHKWNRFLRMYEGVHWDQKRPNWKASSVENITFAIIETLLPSMIENEPTILTEAKLRKDQEKAKQLQQVIASIWSDISMNKELKKLARDFLMFGTGIFKVGWDPNAYNGLGQIFTKSVDPFDILVDPHATDPADLEWLIYKKKISILELRRQFGDKAKGFVPDAEFNNNDENRFSDQDSKMKCDNSVVLYEDWKKGEDGKWVLRYFANNRKIHEQPNPYEIDSPPFVFARNYVVNGKLWSLGEFENLEKLQLETNKLRSLVIDQIQNNASGVWFVDQNSGVEKGTFSGRPGQVVYKTPGSEIRREPGMNVPNSVVQQIELNKDALEYVSGVHSVLYGKAPSNVSAASALAILTEQAMGRIKSKISNIEDAVVELGRMWVALIRQFYDVPREMRVKDETGHTQYMEFNGADLREQGINPQGQEVEFLADFDISVKAGSSMRVNKSAKYEMAKEMHSMGALDTPTLIEISEVAPVQQTIEALIKEGKQPDPNQPQIDVAGILNKLGLRFSMQSSDFNTIYQAMSNYQQQYQAATGGLTPPDSLPPELNQLRKTGQIPPELLDQVMAMQQDMPQMPPTGAPIPMEGQMPLEGQMPPIPPQGM